MRTEGKCNESNDDHVMEHQRNCHKSSVTKHDYIWNNWRQLANEQEKWKQFVHGTRTKTTTKYISFGRFRPLKSDIYQNIRSINATRFETVILSLVKHFSLFL